VAKKRKTNPNRFQKQDEQRLFTFDPVRRNVLLWGVATGAVGGLFMLQQGLLWQLVGVFAIVFISNYHISRAARRIPRWHAAIFSFVGMMVAVFAIVLVGTTLMVYFGTSGGE
jgi:hypothetical protein